MSADTLDFMPGVVLTSKLCPKHVEATTYALLAGFQNFGQQVARTGGVFAMDALELQPEPAEGSGGGGCDFSALPALLLVSHTLLPLLTVPLTWVLIPDANMRDNLPGIDGGSAAGSEAGGDGSESSEAEEEAAGGSERRGLLRPSEKG